MEFTRTLLAQIDALYELYKLNGPRPVLAAWEEYCDLTGKPIEVDCQSRLVRGVMSGLDTDGALLVKTADGLERVLAGDVKPGQPAPR